MLIGEAAVMYCTFHYHSSINSIKTGFTNITDVIRLTNFLQIQDVYQQSGYISSWIIPSRLAAVISGVDTLLLQLLNILSLVEAAVNIDSVLNVLFDLSAELFVPCGREHLFDDKLLIPIMCWNHLTIVLSCSTYHVLHYNFSTFFVTLSCIRFHVN